MLAASLLQAAAVPDAYTRSQLKLPYTIRDGFYLLFLDYAFFDSLPSLGLNNYAYFPSGEERAYRAPRHYGYNIGIITARIR